MTTQVTVMSGQKGDIFWDLAPWMVYSPGLDIGCNIYVANPTDTAMEYALMARLSRDNSLLSEEALPVYGYTWFQVEPGDFAILKGALRFNESNAHLTVSLIERETGETIDSVITSLVAPSADTSALPPSWPGTGTGGTGTDWNSAISAMVPSLMFFVLGVMMIFAMKPEKEVSHAR